MVVGSNFSTMFPVKNTVSYFICFPERIYNKGLVDKIIHKWLEIISTDIVNLTKSILPSCKIMVNINLDYCTVVLATGI